ncbi:MAG TPA: polyprenyl diphosphate synthase [Pirellulales bacterium]
MSLPRDRVPRHVAVIMDGNGRWAERKGLPRFEGHRRGAAAAKACIRECVNLGVEHLTLYCLSSENWKRPAIELTFLMRLLHWYLQQERKDIIEQNIRFTMIGRREGVPDAILREIDETARVSAGSTGLNLRMAINYGGRGELVDAVRRIATEVQAGRLPPEAIDETHIAASLYTGGAPDPDLLIRTAGEMRVSNFLLWQISYAEIWVTDRCWPDFRPEDLHAAFLDYSRRNRRFGGLPQ